MSDPLVDVLTRIAEALEEANTLTSEVVGYWQDNKQRTDAAEDRRNLEAALLRSREISAARVLVEYYNK